MSPIGNREPDLRADGDYARTEAVAYETRAEVVGNLLERRSRRAWFLNRLLNTRACSASRTRQRSNFSDK
jgi:hypothetical protein